MTDLELDAWAAEKVMGWERARYEDDDKYAWWCDAISGPWFPVTDDDVDEPPAWSPTRRADHDYLVLEKLRKERTGMEMVRMATVIWRLWKVRAEMDPILMYKPGDYTRAAYAAMEGKDVF